MLARIRKTMEEKDQGFTLIELLVVVVIIGILAAIAIPTFLNQREKAWKKAAASDLRNAAVKAEEYFSDKGVYPPAKTAFVDDTATGGGDYRVKFSDGVAWDDVVATPSSYCLEVTHEKIAGKTFVLNSTQGVAGMVGDKVKIDGAVVTLAACTP